jgi:hypothetical protein
VTGASGFIGRRLVKALADSGADVTILCRSRGAAAMQPPSVRMIVGELHDRRLLANALADREIVFHLAYDGRATAADNLAAFDSLLGAAAGAGVGRIVQTSSIVVYDDWPNGDIDEGSSMSRPGGSGYRQAKIEMERRLMAGSIPAAILQPTIVYGPGSTLWTDQFLEWLAVGDIVLPTPEGHCSHCPTSGRSVSSSPGPNPFHGRACWRDMRGSSAAAASGMSPWRSWKPDWDRRRTTSTRMRVRLAPRPFMPLDGSSSAASGSKAWFDGLSGGWQKAA